MGEQETITYTAVDGTTVELVVRWAKHSGRIPPPKIEFYDHALDARIAYYYGGLPL